MSSSVQQLQQRSELRRKLQAIQDQALEGTKDDEGLDSLNAFIVEVTGILESGNLGFTPLLDQIMTKMRYAWCGPDLEILVMDVIDILRINSS